MPPTAKKTAAMLAERPYVPDAFDRAFGGSGGFEPEATRPRRVWTIDGIEKAGKTDFACTAPDPILYQCFDIGGAEGVIRKFQDGTRAKKRIKVISYDTQFPFGATDVQRAAICDKAFAAFRDDYITGLKTARTIVWDKGGQVWQCLRYAQFGKLLQVPPLKYTQVNMEFSDLIQRVYSNHKPEPIGYGRDVNLLILHNLGAEWADVEKKGSDGQVRSMGEKTGKLERSGAFKDIGFLVQAEIRVRFDRQRGTVAEIVTCRDDMNLSGRVVEGADFYGLAMETCPSLDPSVWEK